MKTFTVKILDAIESLAGYCTTDDAVEEFEQQYRETEEIDHVCASARFLLKVWPDLTRIFGDREITASMDEYGSPVTAEIKGLYGEEAPSHELFRLQTEYQERADKQRTSYLFDNAKDNENIASALGELLALRRKKAARQNKPYLLTMRIDMAEGCFLSFDVDTVPRGTLDIEERFACVEECYRAISLVETGSAWINEALEHLITEGGRRFDYCGQHQVLITITEER